VGKVDRESNPFGLLLNGIARIGSIIETSCQGLFIFTKLVILSFDAVKAGFIIIGELSAEGEIRRSLSVESIPGNVLVGISIEIDRIYHG